MDVLYSTMMMASHQQQGGSATKSSNNSNSSNSSNALVVAPRKVTVVDPAEGPQSHQDTSQSPTAVVSAHQPPSQHANGDGPSRSSTEGYANPPFLPNPNHHSNSSTIATATTIPPNREPSSSLPTASSSDPQSVVHQTQAQQQQQPLVYVNRAKRAASTSEADQEEQRKRTSAFYSTSLVASEAEAVARRNIRLSCIKSAARAIDGQQKQQQLAQQRQQQQQTVVVMPATSLPDPGSQATPVSPNLQGAPSPTTPLDGPTAMAIATAATTTSLTRETSTTSTATSSTVGTDVFGQPIPPRGVPHVYHDFANVPDSVGYVRKKTGGVTQPFPEKLHELLEKESTPDFRDNVHAVVGWLPHGRAFLVRKPKEFTRDIMPKYFRQTKLTSFQRQLNLYGFRRITQGTDAGAYYHELFLRGRPQLCLRMVRQKVKGTGHKQPADAQTEPNFYALPPTTGSANANTTTTTTTTVVQVVPANTSSSPAVSAMASPPSIPAMPPSSPPQATTAVAPPPVAVPVPTLAQQQQGTVHQVPLAAPAPVAPTAPPPATSFSTMAHVEMSPGTQGVHGAASLLKGIAAGLAPSRLNSIKINPNAAVPFLGPPADKPYDSSGTMLAAGPPSLSTATPKQPQEPQQQQQPTSTQPKRSSYSTLLWGGGTPAPSPAPANPGSSFLWPPAPTAPPAPTENGAASAPAASAENQEAV